MYHDVTEFISAPLLFAAGIALFGGLNGKTDDALVSGLAEHVADVEAHGALCDAKLLCNLMIAHVAADALEYGKLALRELYPCLTKGGGAQRIGIDLGARHRCADAVGERFPRGLLVDKAVGTCCTRPVQKGDFLHPCHEDNAQVGKRCLQALTDLYAARAPLHADVHENEIGAEPPARGLCQFRERAGADDTQILHGREDFDKPFEQYFLIVYE